MDTGIATTTSRQEDLLRSAHKFDPSQNANTSQQPASSSRPTIDHSPFTPDEHENVVKLDGFDSFLDYFQKKYVSSWTRANTESDCILHLSYSRQNSLVSSYSPKQIGTNSNKFAKNTSITEKSSQIKNIS